MSSWILTQVRCTHGGNSHTGTGSPRLGCAYDPRNIVGDLDAECVFAEPQCGGKP